MAVLAAFITFMVVIAGVALGAESVAASPYDAEERQFLELINAYRQGNGLGTLVLSDTLSVAAERHSQDMARHGFFAHDTVASSFYPAGSEPWDRMSAEGYDYDTFKGENLAAGYETAEESFEGWRSSPGHNAAMLDGNYKVMGVARVFVPGSRYGWYWTTDFGGVVDPSARVPGADPENGARQETPERPPEDRGGVENGDMRNGDAWEQKTRDGKDLILDSGVARFGAYHEGVDDLRQKIRISEGDSLTYRIRIKTEEPEPAFDFLAVRLLDEDGERIATLERYSDADAGGWRREELDLSRYAGRTVYLSFRARTDERLFTNFYLDDVALETAGG